MPTPSFNFGYQITESGRILVLNTVWPRVGSYSVDVRLAAGVALILAYFAVGYFAAMMKWIADKIVGPEEEEEEEVERSFSVPASPSAKARALQSSFVNALEPRLKSIENQLSRLSDRLDTVETQTHAAASAPTLQESHTNTNIPLPAPTAAGPPPPPPPPPPMQAPAPRFKIVRKEGGKKPAVQEDDQPSMAQVLRELSLVQRKVTNIISSPRAQYLRHRHTSRVSFPALRRTAMNPDRGNDSEDEENEKSRPAQSVEKSEDGSEEEQESGSDNEMSSPLRKKSRVNSPVPGIQPTTLPSAFERVNRTLGGLVGFGSSHLDRIAEDEKVNVMHSDQTHIPKPRTKLFEQNEAKAILRSKLDHNLAAANHQLANPDILSELTTHRLRKTNIPRSPGGTTLIPQRKVSKTTEDIVSNLKAQFAKAYSNNRMVEKDEKEEDKSPFE